MSRFLASAFVITSAFLALAVSASAAEFNGKCTDFKQQADCAASGWCRWSVRKPITLPNGQVHTPAGYCAFKSGMKEGYAATVTPAATK